MKTLLVLLLAVVTFQGKWHKVQEKQFTVHYQSADRNHLAENISFFKKGIQAARMFFRKPMPESFHIYIHPGRRSLDSTWQHDWKMPEFKSECWMVASGVADRLDLIAPVRWDVEACEHKYGDRKKIQQLITHEIVHVFHGQLNKSRDFSETDRIDWFVEGLATFASGQLDKEKVAQVEQVLRDNQVPASLDHFWKGRTRYALSGSIVAYIDTRWGRKKLVSLLPLVRKADILKALGISEERLILDWKASIQATKAGSKA
ncbi:MAG TPA: hypothetical protein VFZ78_00730 [Flavisolibacter sp.]